MEIPVGRNKNVQTFHISSEYVMHPMVVCTTAALHTVKVKLRNEKKEKSGAERRTGTSFRYT